MSDHKVMPVRETTLPTLTERMERKIDHERRRVQAVLERDGARPISEVSVAQAYGGMRGVRCMVTETSAVDPHEGIRFRG